MARLVSARKKKTKKRTALFCFEPDLAESSQLKMEQSAFIERKKQSHSLSLLIDLFRSILIPVASFLLN